MMLMTVPGRLLLGLESHTSASADARGELATQLARIATEVGAHCDHARGAWQTRAAPVVAAGAGVGVRLLSKVVPFALQYSISLY